MQWHDVPSSLPILSILSILFAPAKLWASKFCWLTCWARSWCRVIYGDSHSLQGRLCCNLSHVLVWFRQARQPGVCASWNNRGTHCVMSSWMLASPILIPHFTLHPSLKAQSKAFSRFFEACTTMETSVWTFSSKLLLEYDRMNIVRRSIRTAIKFCLLQKKPRRTEYLEAKLRRPHRIWWHTMSYN